MKEGLDYRITRKLRWLVRVWWWCLHTFVIYYTLDKEYISLSLSLSLSSIYSKALDINQYQIGQEKSNETVLKPPKYYFPSTILVRSHSVTFNVLLTQNGNMQYTHQFRAIRLFSVNMNTTNICTRHLFILVLLSVM